MNKSKTAENDRKGIKYHLDRVVRGSVEETLNALLDAEADRLCNAQRLQAHRGSPRYPSRALRTQDADQGRRGQAADTETLNADL
jgi:hypothetical protein